jgi:hypothetical protein
MNDFQVLAGCDVKKLRESLNLCILIWRKGKAKMETLRGLGH